MKVFVLSLHRCGTRSTVQFLINHGLRVCHNPRRYKGEFLEGLVNGIEENLEAVVDVIRPVLEEHDAVADVPMPALGPLLARDYPDARFILLTRPAADWVQSVRRHIGHRWFVPYERVQYWHYVKRRPRRIDQIEDEALTQMLHAHVNNRMSERTFLGHLYDPDLGSSLGKFLGLPEDHPFPHMHRG